MSDEGRLRRELRKRGPFDSLEQEAMLALARTHDYFQIQFTRLFREHGLTPAQYNVLRILRGEGSPLPCLEIAARLVTAVPGITGLVDRLEALGLVERRRCDLDRRVIHVAITPRALDLLESLDVPVNSLHRQLIGHLSRDDLRTLVRLLDDARRPGSNADV